MWSRSGEDWRTAWGYTFKWTSEHLTPEQMAPMRFSYDTLGAECLDRLDAIRSQVELRGATSEPSSSPGSSEKPHQPHNDLYTLLRDHHSADAKLTELWTQLNTVPSWVSWPQLSRGQAIFYRYAGPTVVALTFQSLLGGMAGHRVVETLSRTGGFSVRVARRRLLETFQHLLLVTSSLAAIQPGGAGWASTIRVRLLHASVRRRILALEAQRPGYYPVAAMGGVPISDLDSLGTVSTFSSTLVWLGYPRQGIRLGPQEAADLVALWRYLAHLLGAPTWPLASASRARAAMESMLAAGEIAPSPASRRLAGNVVRALAGQPPAYASAAFLHAEAHWLNGRELSDALGVPRPPVYFTALVGAQCLFFVALAWMGRLMPKWRERRVERVKRLLHRLTMEQVEGVEATHEFKYIPSLAMLARDGAGGGGIEGNAQEHAARLGTGVERRNVKVLVVASAFVGLLAWTLLKLAAVLFRMF